MTNFADARGNYDNFDGQNRQLQNRQTRRLITPANNGKDDENDTE